MNKFENRQKQARKIVAKHYLRQFLIDKKFTFSSVILAGIGSTLVFYVPPLVIAKVLEKYSATGIPDLNVLTPYLLAFAGFWLLGEAFWRVTIHLMIRADFYAMGRLYANGLNYLLHKDLSFFQENFAGSLTKKTLAYGKNYEGVFDTFIFEVASRLLALIFACYILFQFSPILVAALLGWLAVLVLLLLPLIRRRSKLVAIRETSSNIMSGYVADIYTNIDAVRAYAREKFEFGRHKANTNDLMEKSKKSWDYHNQRLDMVVAPLYVATNVFGIVFALWTAPRIGATIDVVFITFTYFANVTRFMWDFNNIYRRVETNVSEAAQFTELLLDEPTIHDAKRPEKFAVTKGVIEFKNVSFDHEENSSNDSLFSGLNIRVKSGEKIGLVGHSGGGKTTLTKLIMRLMDIDSGEILIDGLNIAKARQTELREQLAYVPQEPIMFHRSLSENIAYGKQNATQSEIENAAKQAHAHEFISKLSSGYDTLVGERGVKLSGGQRQRVAIARAMLKNAPILLLDEATSALDSESEKLIQDALWKLMKDKTTIVIAHRLSTIQKMDRILVMENGEIIEEGDHKQLLVNDGIYAELWKHQSGGFLEE
jgi:ATP-binding cassette subfamily B protein